MNHCLIFNVFNTERFSAGRSAGAYRIAHVLRENYWDVEVIDFAMNWSLRELQLLVKSRVNKNTKFFGFSHMFSIWSDTLETFVEWCRVEYPDLKYISGCSVNPLFNSKQIDYYIQGYGENALLTLLKYLFSNGEKPRMWLNTGKRIINAISDYPSYPLRDLSIDYEARDFINPNEWLTVEFSRGCKFSCDFCNFPLIGFKEDTTRSQENFILDMERNFDKWGTTNYIAADETFNDRTEKIIKFADGVDKLSFTPFYTGFVRPDLLISRKEDREHMARMNFRGHYYGVESFNRESSKAVSKGMHPDRLKQGLIDVKQYFKNNGNGLYRGTIGLIIGLPYETEQTLRDTRKWLLDNWKGECYIAWPLVIPNHELDLKSKFIDYTKYGYSSMTDEEINIKQKTLNSNLKEILNYDPFNPLALEGLYWKNNVLDIFKVRELIVELFYNQETYKEMDLKADNYEIASYIYGAKSVSQRIEMQTPRIVGNNQNFIQETLKYGAIESYKQRKLSI